MNYFSMFSGIKGFELGIKRATNDKWKCIGYSEIDKYAIQTGEKHFNHKNYGGKMELKRRFERKVMKVSDIKFDKTNPNKFVDKQTKALSNSIEQFGYVDEIVIEKRRLHDIGS